MKAARLLLAAPLLLTITACGGSNTPGEVTASEAKQLNDAAEMLDDNSVSINEVQAEQAK